MLFRGQFLCLRVSLANGNKCHSVKDHRNNNGSQRKTRHKWHCTDVEGTKFTQIKAQWGDYEKILQHPQHEKEFNWFVSPQII